MLGKFRAFLQRPSSTLKVETLTLQTIRYNSKEKIMRILNVAEKNDAAKTIASLLSGGKARKREGASIYNKIYEFDLEVFNQNSRMIMTSVSGHILNYDFCGEHRFWQSVNPITLFEAPIIKTCISGNESVKNNLQKEVKHCNLLIIWTDCDREGENIGFEIIDICKEVSPNLRVYRAKFSEITYESVIRAIRNLEAPNNYLNNAVNVRMELDLRIGAAFTRFQCLHLKKAFPTALKNNLVSYGSCQFPTLGFVVERFKTISEFISEPFWKIDVKHTIEDLSVNFEWQRHHLFDKLACQVLTDRCLENKVAKVEKVESKPKIKWRPRPLDTVELEKMISKKLKINAKETLKIAEKLYTKGLISYPRTETNIFPQELNLIPLIQQQTGDSNWGDFAQKVLVDGPNPFQGKKSDQAHPPIHPIKYSNALNGNEKVVYEFIVRHFLACLSKHAEGFETIVEISIAGEKFFAKGLVITAKNYLEVYPYEKWTEKEIHTYKENDTFIPEISMNEGQTTPPKLLTEADLISLMEKHGIGTDATHAEHIETIKSRLYVGLQDNKYFVPRTLGMGLVEGYNNMGYEMAKPDLRAELEADLKKICDNEKTPIEVLSKYINSYKVVLEGIQKKANRLSETIETYIQVEAVPVETTFLPSQKNGKFVKKCSSCQSSMFLKSRKENLYYIGCSNYPTCREAFWFPQMVKEVEVTDEICPTCTSETYMLKFNFVRGSCYLPSDYIGCIGGCDQNLLEILNCKYRKTHQNTTANTSNTRELPGSGNHSAVFPETSDSGYGSFEGNESSSLISTGENLQLNCECKVLAKELKVKNLGPNFGRTFYKCGFFPKKCNFFEWQKENTVANHVKKKMSRKNPTDEEGEITRCYCAIPGKRLTVSKDGPNKGKEFFSCGKSRTDSDKCNFFKWVNESRAR